MELILKFLVGIGVFLFSVKLFGSSLEKIASNKIRGLLNTFVKGKFKSFIFGVLLAFVLQSGSSALVMVVGLVGISFISILQAVTIIIGVNVGSALAMILLALESIKITDYFTLFTTIGVFMLIIAKKENTKNVGNLLLGFGMFFVGLMLIGDATAVLKNSPLFAEFFLGLTNPIVLILVGFAATFIVQSSTGTVAVLVTLVSGTGLMTLSSAMYVVFGANVGSALATGLMILPTTNNNGAKIIFWHVAFNIIGIVILSLLTLIPNFFGFLSFMSPAMQVIAFDFAFNTITALLTLPFSNKICSQLEKVGAKRKPKHKQKITIDKDISILALMQLQSEVVSVFKTYKTLLITSAKYTTNDTTIAFTTLSKSLADIHKRNDELLGSLSKINSSELGGNDLNIKNNLKDLFTGIEKSITNTQKLLNNSDVNGENVRFNKKQTEYIVKIREELEIIVNKLSSIIEENSHNFASNKFQNDIKEVLDALDKATIIKINAKKMIVTNAFSQEDVIEKYTNFLSVINYYEQISTNLTDMTLSIAKYIVPEEIDTSDIEKLVNEENKEQPQNDITIQNEQLQHNA